MAIPSVQPVGPFESSNGLRLLPDNLGFCCSIASDCALIASANRSRISASDPFASVAAGVDADKGVSSIHSIAALVDSGGGALRFACPSTGFGANVDDVLS
ncbi:hypothetical protein HPB50_021748 [Hyalomma asiaticum]|uniref:Uncharacterized protein n=1 Tax=Hyalomma asiaticum TaxID=266040 RepID=A0ACB7T0V7_HYAAI|nr:hypothetical protein HPB50_021748 [Hyalomma asiaticum]